jgi:hypothetical protein
MKIKASKLIAISLTALAIITASPAFAGRSSRSGSVQVRGYTTKSGTYVAPHRRTTPDHSIYNNYSTKGNINPYTGKEGTVVPDHKTNASSSDLQSQPITEQQVTTEQQEK